jgi:hypothetical protein
MKEWAIRTLSGHDLKEVWGGKDVSTPSVDSGGGQSSDARIVIIETG